MHSYDKAILLPEETLKYVHKEACEKKCYSIIRKSQVLKYPNVHQ